MHKRSGPFFNARGNFHTHPVSPAFNETGLSRVKFLHIYLFMPCEYIGVRMRRTRTHMHESSK